MTWFSETLYPDWRQSFRVSRVVYEVKTEFQHLAILETPAFGRVLVLDGVIQVTEGDEFVYHEMLAHVPILAHGRVNDVCIIGGGDGGMLREVLKHDVRAVMVEIDQGVIDLCRAHMPSISAGAFDHPRAEIVIADGLAFMAETQRRFDVIIIDSTDPIGPGEALFTPAFYRDCRSRLNPGGIVVTQNGVPFMQPDELKTTHARLKAIFADASFFLAGVPTYVGGLMALAWASDDPAHRQLGLADIRARAAASGVVTRYYTPEIHAASFALPHFVRDLMAGA